MAFQPFSGIPQNQATYAPLINAAAQRRGVNPLFLSSIINAESSGNANARGPRTRYGHAEGLMQFLPSTFEEVANRYNIRGNTFNPEANVEAGAAYYSELRDKFGNDQDALMAYNWGQGNVQRWIEEGRDPDAVPTETKLYVEKVLGGAPSSLYVEDGIDPGLAVQTASAPGPAGARPGDATSLLPMPPGQEINQLPPVMALQEQQHALMQQQLAQAQGGDLLGQPQGNDLLSGAPATAEEPGVMEGIWGKMSSDAGRQAMLDAGAALLGASGWSDRPITMGEAMGAAMKAGSAGYRNTEQQAMQDQLVQAKIDEMERNNASMANMRTQLGLPGTGGDPAAASAGGGGTTVQTASAPGGGQQAQQPKQKTFYDSLSDGERIMLDAANATGDPMKVAGAVQDIQTARLKATDASSKDGFEYADKLRDDYNKDPSVTSYRTLTRNYNEIQRVMKSEQQGGIQDTSMLFNFIKILDPGAAVQEGDKASVENMAPAAQKWAMLYNKLLDEGGSIPPPMRKQIATISQRIHSNAREDVDALTEQYRGIASRHNVNPDDVLLALGRVEEPWVDDGTGGGDGTMTPYAGEPTTEEAPAEAEPPVPPEQQQATQAELDALPPNSQRYIGGKLYEKRADGLWYPVGGE